MAGRRPCKTETGSKIPSSPVAQGQLAAEAAPEAGTLGEYGEAGSGQVCGVHEGVRRLIELFPRVARGLRRTVPSSTGFDRGRLGNRHRSLLSAIYEGEATVGALATTLGLSLATTSGLIADLERAGFVERYSDPADRRRTIVRVPVSRRGCAGRWLDGSNVALVRAMEHLSPQERAALVKAMTYLDGELNGTAGTTLG
ncbi:MAG: MarR family winged helix-turn-helix transcriptional regulator [Acidimicrobiales bacterium]